MGRAAEIEAFARLLDGAPAASVPPSVAALGRTVAALQGVPAPALPASLAGGGVALLARPAVSVNGTHTAAAVHVIPHGTRIAGTGAIRTGATVSKLAAAKATVFGVLTAHLVPVVAGTAVLAVGVTGIAVGASRSLPGDPLYGVKRATESVHTATATTGVSAAERRLDLATTRLHEALALQARGASTEQIMAEVHQWLGDVSSALPILAPLAATPAVKAKLAAFVATNGAGLSRFPAAAVAPATAAVAQISVLIDATVSRVTGAVPSHLPVRLPTAGTHPLTVPSIAGLPRHAPTTVPSIAVTKPSLHVNGPTLAASAPAVGLPGLALPSALPTALPSALPTALPSALPSLLPSIPVPVVSDVTTLLQGLPPKH